MGLVVGFCGPAQSGKDTCGDYLISRHGFHKKLSFAGNLKEMVKEVFSLTDYDVNDREGKQKPFTYSVILDKSNLSLILSWMYKTHSDFHVSENDVNEVLSHLGRKFKTPRELLQFVGTDICRKIVPTYHLDIIKQEVLSNPETDYVVTDVRFPNEGNLILDVFGGFVVRLFGRPEKSIEENNHPSETAMLDWGRATAAIDNEKNGLHYLYSELDAFLRRENII